MPDVHRKYVQATQHALVPTNALMCSLNPSYSSKRKVRPVLQKNWNKNYRTWSLKKCLFPFLTVCDEDKHLKYFKMFWSVGTQPFGCNRRIRKRCVFTKYWDTTKNNNLKTCFKKLNAHCQSTKNKQREYFALSSGQKLTYNCIRRRKSMHVYTYVVNACK